MSVGAIVGATICMAETMRSSAFHRKKRDKEYERKKLINNCESYCSNNFYDHETDSLARKLNELNTKECIEITSSGYDVIVWYFGCDRKEYYRFCSSIAKDDKLFNETIEKIIEIQKK